MNRFNSKFRSFECVLRIQQQNSYGRSVGTNASISSIIVAAQRTEFYEAVAMGIIGGRGSPGGEARDSSVECISEQPLEKRVLPRRFSAGHEQTRGSSYSWSASQRHKG